MIAAESTSTARRFAPLPPKADALTNVLQTIRPAPAGVPQALWESALIGPITEFLSRPGKCFRGRLVELAWRLGGRTDSPAAELPLIVELLHAGSLIIDDIEDDSVQRRGRIALHRQVGVPLALNAGNWLYFWPLSLLGDLRLPLRVESELHRQVAHFIRRCHEGQALDLTARVGDLHPSEIPGVAQTISAWKTGSLMALAAALGAIAGEADATTVDALITFGERLGVGLQMQNDLSELTGAAGPLKHPEDLLHGRVTWPWAWAAERLPANVFDALQRRGAKLAEGAGCAASLARDLLSALGTDPGRPVREWLGVAFSELSAALPASASLTELREELSRLEQRYA